MAERRMFAKSLIDSDLFLDMPLSTQALYFHLSMRADDEGFVNNPKKILRMIGANEDSLRLLIAKQFILPFDSGIVVIKHWRIHNYIQKDRFKKTTYTEEKALIVSDENGEYNFKTDSMDTTCIQDVSEMDTQVRLGKVSIGKDRIDNIGDEKTSPARPKVSNFKKPSIDEIKAYCRERKNSVNAERFFDYYESNGWKVGKNSMKDWKAAVRTWERNGYSNSSPAKPEDDLVQGEDGFFYDRNGDRYI